MLLHATSVERQMKGSLRHGQKNHPLDHPNGVRWVQADQEDWYMERMPARMKEFIWHGGIGPLSPEHCYDLCQWYGEDTALALVKAGTFQDHAKAFGQGIHRDDAFERILREHRISFEALVKALEDIPRRKYMKQFAQ